MTQKQSTIFINHFTVVDHAYIDNEGRIIGGSFLPSVDITGPVEQEEQVVIDFSTCKKEIKAAIDEVIDHKLWLIIGYSNINKIYIENSNWVIKTPAVEVCIPVSRLFVYDAPDYSLESTGRMIEEVLQKSLRDTFVGVTYKVRNSEVVLVANENAPIAFFRYTHGLKSSSSYGCKNIAHGHMSFIEFETKHEHQFDEAQEFLDVIAGDLDNCVFVFRENIIDRSDNKCVVIGYSVDGEDFFIRYDTTKCKIVVFDEETTIENIANEIVRFYRIRLTNLGVTKVYVSEGSSKGAVVEV